MDAAVLCPAVCNSDVMEKGRIRGKGIKIRHELDFFCSSLVKCKPTLLLRPSELRFEAKCPSSFFEYRTIE